MWVRRQQTHTSKRSFPAAAVYLSIHSRVQIFFQLVKDHYKVFKAIARKRIQLNKVIDDNDVKMISLHTVYGMMNNTFAFSTFSLFPQS